MTMKYTLFFTRRFICRSLSIAGLLLFAQLASAQEPLAIRHSCNFASAADTLTEVYTYESSTEAKQIIERVMQVNVLPQNFIIKSADCNNALATTLGKQRYILYSTAFLENFKKEANTKWAAYCVLAHEIGHHLSNHDLEETNPAVRKKYELEADRFAGGILFRLGATLEEAQAGINTFSLETASQTHPPKRARLEALAVGWKQAEEQAAVVENTGGAAAPDSDEKKLYQQALAEKDPYAAIELLDQAIEIKEDFADAYLERGKRKIDVEDVEPNRVNYRDAADDLTVYISMRPKNAVAYAERGYAHYQFNDSLAMSDFNRAIRLDAKCSDAYYGRAFMKINRNEPEAALKDLEKVIQIRPDYAEGHYWHGNVQYGLGQNEKAITDFDRALKADSMHYHALSLRAATKMFSGRAAEALADYLLLERRHPKDFKDNFDLGKCYQLLGKHRECIAEFDKILTADPDVAEAYLYRGVSKETLSLTAEADKDYKKYVAERTSDRVLAKLESLHTADEDLAISQLKIGCLLVEIGQPKAGLVWLDLALASRPDLTKAKECKAAAMKK